MTEHRRFTILDAMILIVGLGIGMVWVIRDLQLVDRYRLTKPGGPIRSWIDDEIPLLITPVTTALLATRLKSPLPTRRRLFREPGFVACAAAGFMLLSTAFLGLLFALASRAELWWNFKIYQTYWMRDVAPAVAGAWLLLLVSGRWRSERTWDDRLGRCLGVILLISRFAPLCAYFWDGLPTSAPPP
jgi:hypothetical protein